MLDTVSIAAMPADLNLWRNVMLLFSPRRLGARLAARLAKAAPGQEGAAGRARVPPSGAPARFRRPWRFIAGIPLATMVVHGIAAEFEPVWLVVVGTTLGRLAASVSVVLIGHLNAHRLPLTLICWSAAALFFALEI